VPGAAHRHQLLLHREGEALDVFEEQRAALAGEPHPRRPAPFSRADPAVKIGIRPREPVDTFQRRFGGFAAGGGALGDRGLAGAALAAARARGCARRQFFDLLDEF